MVASHMVMQWGIFIIIYAGIGRWLLPNVIRLFIQHDLTAENYNDENIPIGMGMYLWIMLIIYILLLKTILFLTIHFPVKLGWDINMNLLYIYIIALSVVAFMGWLDDSIGDKKAKGFSGHWNKWKNEKIITTGMLKVGVVSIMALWLVLETYVTFGTALLKFMLIVLMTNTMNLLDLRPGRTLKVFFVLCLALILFGTSFHQMELLLPVLISAVLLFHSDLKAKIMLGDTGANFLGFALGTCLSIYAPLWFQMVILCFVMSIHWTAAKSSITKIIENHRVLRWLDRWGRT